MPMCGLVYAVYAEGSGVVLEWELREGASHFRINKCP